jgi:predicted Zn-ribbon and HTH transcriptional regulator
MRVRWLQGEASDRFDYEPGKVYDVDEALARVKIANGIAVEADPERCQHCGMRLDEPPAPREAAALSTPRRRG